MNKIKICLLAALFFALVLVVYADEIEPLVYQYENPPITVAFSEHLAITPERQRGIADELAGITSNQLIVPGNSTPNNIICTLFGHNLAPATVVTVTHHKVRQHVPRCYMEVYDVTYCTRCDYTSNELTNDFYYDCCPED